VLPLAAELRSAGMTVEIYPDAAKIKKQMSYANQKGIPYVVLIGGNELKERTATLKDMTTGTQEKVPFEELKERVKGVMRR
jgi:histidyl-tRNA synthetase